MASEYPSVHSNPRSEQMPLGFSVFPGCNCSLALGVASDYVLFIFKVLIQIIATKGFCKFFNRNILFMEYLLKEVSNVLSIGTFKSHELKKLNKRLSEIRDTYRCMK
ncbi:hypothetical protein M5K25_007436 [Dendrobium thyrsiflorum]|uniref:Uncharacterized protein n=1 Tax=Dendrobium thyrsiflorum TaxID=117978 RepID=A0ABD0VLA0_DENTH